MRRDDPFSVPDAGFERWEGLQNDGEFSQPDLTPTTLKTWLRSQEAEKELGQMSQRPARTVVEFMNSANGLELHITRGDVTKIYSGPESELIKIARAAS